METKQISAQTRQRQAKGDNRRLRREGMVPGIVYGGKATPLNVVVNDHEVELILRGARRSNLIFNLQLNDGASEQTLIREVQRHPVTGRLIHMDFLRVDLEQVLEVEVPIHGTGTPIGVKNGGILEHVTRAITVRCKPLAIPSFLEVDLTNLDVNQSLHVGQMQVPEGVEVVDDPSTPLFAVVTPAAVATETPAEGEAPAQPELIGEKKKDEEEEEK